MSKKDESFWDGLLKTGAVIGGAWLLVSFIDLLGKKVYRCSNCGGIIETKHINQCPHCKIPLEWRV